MSEIKSTTNYDLFIFLDCNRDPKETEQHVLDLMRKITKKNLLPNLPILVNDRFEIIDGQHRCKAAERLGVPIYYIMDEHATPEDISGLNSSQRPWNPKDYINHHAALGNQEYVRLKAFLEKHGIPHQMVIYNTENNTKGLKDGSYKFMSPEEEDRLVDILEKGKELIDALNIASFLSSPIKYSVFKSTTFRRALYSFLLRDDVDFKHFRKNFILLADRFKKCATRESYTSLFLEIYNYRLVNRID